MSGVSSCSDSNTTTAYIQQLLQARIDPNQAQKPGQPPNQDGTPGAANAPQPTVNSQGQPLGTLVNAAA
jgi:hypothetical protein